MSKMIKTNIPWLPELSEDFTIGAVKHLFFVSKDLSDDGEPDRVLKLARTGIVEKDVTINEGQMAASYAGYNKVQIGDLLLNPMDLYSGANCNVSEIAGVISPAYTNLRAKVPGKIVPKYYDYYFKCQYWLMAMFAHGKGVSFDNRWTINNDTLRSYEVPIPPYETQKRIVECIQAEEPIIDSLIANQEAQIERLKQYKQSIIAEIVTKGIDPGTTMKDSGVEWMGIIPENWRVVPSKYLFCNCDERRRDGDVQLTASQKYGMISQEEYMQRENARIVLADKGLENWKHVEPNDFVISLRSFQGGLEMSSVRGCATWHYIVLRAKEEIYPLYYKWLFKSQMYITALQRTCNYIRDGQDLRYSNFVQVPLCIPPLEEQEKIATYIENWNKKIDSLIAIKQAKIDKAQQYRRAIIYEYVTGMREVV